ncbi:T9SS type A sorting domain-containing protein [Flavobacterium sp. MAH-1]|uniref:T9SS type A sorting domain-containing protein n=1 Tax=Flavobacterium agri TaxID=2743471 RepID=A0A7Y8Y2Y1_9FLAO|nr:T9SS type A sorting domain-containing protein [Flavobacterium agri]NUY81537.1 T9SS type A sorting domain-containing protein [Flavobacterium agri]NYA71561.1 T9SS type A sorting domain-containing protein [Flavobacterium agri]
MKQTLLSIFALICFVFSNGQTAYQAPGVYVCNQAPANVQSMTPFVLGAQNPANFTVTYHLYEADAVANVNAIPGLLNYCCGGMVTVYARVTSNSSANFAISNFKTVWDLPNYTPIIGDIWACETAQLPDVEFGAFYTGPFGTGFQYPPGAMITPWTSTNGYMYWYAGNDDCYSEVQFYVLVDTTPILWEPTMTNCVGDENFNLTQAISTTSAMTFYHTQEDAMNMINPIANPEAYPGTEGEIVWVLLQSFCTNIQPLTLHFQTCTPNTIYGKVGISQNGSTCDVSDPGLQNCKMSRTFDGQTSYAYTNANGNYMFTNVPVGANTVAPVPTQPYITVLNPTSTVINTFTNSQLQANFCVNESPYGDVRMIMQSMGNFRPNITTQVFLQVANLGNFTASGTVTLTYDASKTSYVSSSLAPVSNVPGTLTFNYNVQPNYGQPIYVSFYTPTTTVMGDVLAFNATASLSGDQDLTNNSATMSETVVNSYDPNDISVAEGAFISPAQATGYLHYIVRFQNTGTAEAFDIRIDNPLNELLDADTFRPVAASHTYFTERTGSNVSFRFPNIDLPASSVDEPNSHGWVIYEVKPVAGIEVGDVISNQAFIYFDTNPAIDTNTVTTTVQQLSTHESRADIFAIYPNPTIGKFTIRSMQTSQLDMEITDARGTKVLSKKLSLVSNEVSVDISGLSSGLYFVKMASENGSSVKKLMVK